MVEPTSAKLADAVPIQNGSQGAHKENHNGSVGSDHSGHARQLPVAASTQVSPKPVFNPPWEKDSYASTAIAEIMDRASHATMGRLTGGLSPGALHAAYLDWLTHLVFSPGKQMQLLQKGQKKSARFLNHAARCAWKPQADVCAIVPLSQDKRFDDPAWNQWPFNLISQGFLFTQQWWHNATTDIRGVTPQHERAIEFAARQFLDMVAPSNFVWSNPEVIQKTLMTGGLNFVQGWQNFLEDLGRVAGHQPPVGADQFKVGENLAITPGKVVFRNRLIELIQYTPKTGKVFAEPIVIVPAWIMKYYILDLSPENSLVRHLVVQGHTVYMVSWKNPGPEDRELGMEDYRTLGVVDALDAVSKLQPDTRIHGVGYCLGGTLMGIAAAIMARNSDNRLATLTLLASQFDFSEAGELTLFINESQVSFLEDVMWERGFLDARQMAGAFQLLRSNDLIWSRIQKEYLLGERGTVNDLMAWNSDATRMPYKMHSEYLRKLFLNNDLSEGRYIEDMNPVGLWAIDVPIFAVGTTRDHVAPWRSAFKVHHLTVSDVTFVLTNGGHNAGIVSEPGHSNRHYQIKLTRHLDGFIDPDSWKNAAIDHEGSWWLAWTKWLESNSGDKVAPPPTRYVGKQAGRAGGSECLLVDAPGTYVFME